MRIKLLSAALLALALPLSSQITSALDAAPDIPKENLVTLSGAVEQRSGDDVRGTVTATILDGWHINSNKPLDEFVIPTALKLDGADLTGVQFPPHVLRSFTFSGGSQLAVFEGTIRIAFTATLHKDATSIGAKLHYQACNDKVCLPPRDATTAFGVAAPASGAGLATDATSANSATTNGPMHGAATMPTNSPMVSAPAAPARPPERLAMNCGTRNSHAPNIDVAITTIRPAMPTCTAMLCSHAPNNLPLSAAATPRTE